jgi:hypothetical protein
MEKMSKIHNTLSVNNSRVSSQEQKVTLPALDNKRNTPADSLRNIEELSMLEVEALEEQILQKAKEQPSLLVRDVLKMEVKKHE